MSGAEIVLQIPESIKKDTQRYRQKVADLLSGYSSADAFRGYRVPRGIYEQRQSGEFMVRVRIAAGLVSPEQLERLALLSRTYGNGVLHVTTRQDIQIHRVKIEHTADVMEGLLEAGLSPRGGGGNTVRNITSCPRAGICTNEAFDVRPYAIALAEYLLDFESSFNLPRKFKVVFSGCSADCALACVADLGFFAKSKDRAKGFSVYAGGGLGSNSRVAVKIEEFIEAGEIFNVAEAVKRLFDEHGDRTNKHRARLRYVLKRLGETEFVRLYRKHLAEVGKEKLNTPAIREINLPLNTSRAKNTEPGFQLDGQYERWKETSVLKEKTPGEFTVQIRLQLGDIAADDLEAVAAVARSLGEGMVRTAQSQDLLLCRVPEADLPAVYAQLQGLHADVVSSSGPKLVACAGASTCRLGLCRSRGLTKAITAELEKTDWPIEFSSQAIRISGCPNSCGQHYISAIGLQGRAKRVGGKLVPCYVVLAGGFASQGQARLAEPVGIVPARNVPALISGLLSLLETKCKAGASWETAIAQSAEQIGELVASHSRIPSAQEAPDYYRDFGCSGEFSLAGRGPGECGAGVMDVIQLDIDQAEQALSGVADAGDAKSKSEGIYKAIVAGARALLITRGLEPRTDREIFSAFTEHLIKQGWVSQETESLLHQAIDYRLGDVEDLTDLASATRNMLARVGDLFRSLDASLNFRAEPLAKNSPEQPQGQGRGCEIDLRGVACPLNFVKAKLELEKIGVGDILEVLLDQGEPAQNVPASFTEQGQEVLEVSKTNGHFRVKVRREH